MSERLAKLEGAFDFAKVTMALLGAVTLGGFSLLSVQVNRVDGRIDRLEQKVDAVSLKVAEMPSLFQRDLQAQTEKLMALIIANRQSSGSPANNTPR